MRRTKIVATVGPASRAPSMLEKLVQAGVNVFRLNFSHGTHEEHFAVIRAVREISARLHRPIALLQDLSGPKIRIGRVREGAELRNGARIVITTDASVEGSAELVSTTYAALPRDVKAGDRVLLDDGNLELRVVGTAGEHVECEVVDGGPLRSNKGINLPGVALSTPALTEKDRRDLAFGVQHRVDFVALSFVRQAHDVLQAKELLRTLGAETPVIAKIEKPQALDNLEAILAAADGVMVARGDLGVEVGFERLAELQEEILWLCEAAHVPVIWATQVLEGMATKGAPSRAEVSDAAMSGRAECVMLNKGPFIVETVRFLNGVLERMDAHQVKRRTMMRRLSISDLG